MRLCNDGSHWVDDQGNYYNKKKRIIKGTITEQGHIRVYYGYRTYEVKVLHRIVWETFVGHIPNGMDIKFKDGNLKNCALDNLICVPHKTQNKRVYCQETNKVYPSMYACGKDIGYSYCVISNIAKQKVKKQPQFHISFIDDE